MSEADWERPVAHLCFLRVLDCLDGDEKCLEEHSALPLTDPERRGVVRATFSSSRMKKSVPSRYNALRDAVQAAVVPTRRFRPSDRFFGAVSSCRHRVHAASPSPGRLSLLSLKLAHAPARRTPAHHARKLQPDTLEQHALQGVRAATRGGAMKSIPRRGCHRASLAAQDSAHAGEEYGGRRWG